jgi:hypothetical protein
MSSNHSPYKIFLSLAVLLILLATLSPPGLLLMVWEFLPLVLLAGLALLAYITLRLRRNHH